MGIELVAAGPEHDGETADLFLRLWLDNGVAMTAFEPDWRERIATFIARARREMDYAAFRAVGDGATVGIAACYLAAGAFPIIYTLAYRRMGYIWCVYVEPAARGQGIARRLMDACLERLKAIGCTEARLHATAMGRPVYDRMGFAPTNEMSLTLR